MKEVYVYREASDTLATISKKVEDAAIEVGVILSVKKKRFLIGECIKNGQCIVCEVPPKEFVELNKTICVSNATKQLLDAKKQEKRFTMDELLFKSFTLLNSIENEIDKCSGDDSDCSKLYNNLHELFYGDKK